MLAALSGSTHRVHTGVALALPPAVADAAGWHSGEPQLSSFHVSTEVKFSVLSAATIEAYIASGQ